MIEWKERRLILAVESSCDETSVAVVENDNIILSNIVASQIESHKRFGGVVPEVASRHHIESITICMEEAMKVADIKPEDLSAVAVTYGPGLVGALLIGINAAKAFAWANNLPLIPVNHMAGHIYSSSFVKPLSFPLIALLVSGGHTELVLMKEDGVYETLGETRDDAAGEAYDKVGRVMGFSYPSGKEIDTLSEVGEDVFHFPRAMINEPNYDFSFSGLKSSFINLVHNAEQRGEKLSIPDLAATFQESVSDVLVAKTLRACDEYKVSQLIIAGGVAANKGLKKKMMTTIKENEMAIDLIVPPVSLCGDNAAMIAAAAFKTYKKTGLADNSLNAVSNLTLD